MSKLYIHKKLKLYYPQLHIGRTNLCKKNGYWRGQSYKDYKNCYKGNEGNEGNEVDSVFVIHKGRIYFDSQFAYCLRTHQTYLVLGPEATEDTLALAEENGCL
jgi:hypothetical protein